MAKRTVEPPMLTTQIKVLNGYTWVYWPLTVLAQNCFWHKTVFDGNYYLTLSHQENIPFQFYHLKSPSATEHKHTHTHTHTHTHIHQCAYIFLMHCSFDKNLFGLSRQFLRWSLVGGYKNKIEWLKLSWKDPLCGLSPSWL